MASKPKSSKKGESSPSKRSKNSAPSPTVVKGEYEDRTRVVCHMPHNGAGDERAFKDVIAFLEEQRQAQIGVDGYTYSNPFTFTGRWWSLGDEGWISDKIVLLIADYKIELTDPDLSLAEKAAELKDTIHRSYAKYGRAQEEIWIVVHRVSRIT